MLNYKKIISRLLDQNIYILSNDDKEAIIIDPGLGFDLIDGYLKSENLSPIAVLATHAHIDHIASANDCIKNYNIPFYICRGNSIMLDHYDIMKGYMHVDSVKPEVSNWIEESEKKITVGSFKFNVNYNPGHSPGCMSFEIDSLIFCGDLIFKGSIGRTDLQTSNPAHMEKSLEMFVNSFDVNSTLLPGHREITTLDYELKTNPFLVKYAK
ncbi:MAG: MBL fold metallo-hydrolase [Candidatus Marinimicrobia bacterium]|nr:MBL fold metallo-hydrolase [Candidatus Neomarinimicrobiota bacterium]